MSSSPSFNQPNRMRRSSLDIVESYEEPLGQHDIMDEHSIDSIPYSKENIPIGHLTSHLEDMTIIHDNDPTSRTAPPTPQPYYLNSTQMRAMSDTSLFIPDTDDSSEPLTSDDIPLIPRSDSLAARSWEERGAAKIVKTETDANGKIVTTIIKKSVKDFKFGKSLGEGSYSTVVLATDKATNQNYAIKVLDKRHIIREKKVKYVNIEKNTLNRLGKRNGIITLYFTFQDEASLYFVLDYAPNGELLSLIKKYGTMNEESVKYYGAQILDGIKFMHDNGVIHRDIKPENILIDYKMTAQITDFGTAKLLEKLDNGKYPADVKLNSFVGTAEYVSPELLNDKYCGKPCDIWAYGCIIYQMIAGKPPFKATNEYLTFQKVCKLQYAFTAGFPLIIRDLIKKILVLNPDKRASIRTIQNHYFFSDVDWSDHEALFSTPPPELGPYKVTAKSMMPVPEMSQHSITKLKQQSIKKSQPLSSSPSLGPATPKLDQSSESSFLNPQGSSSAPHTPLSTPSSKPKKPQNTRSASSAAAAALLKRPSDITGLIGNDRNDSTDADMTPPPSGNLNSNSSSKRGSDLDLYIPGTNILRPVVKSRMVINKSSSNVASGNRSGARSSSSSRKKLPAPSSASNPKVIAVTPMLQIDVAWASYLKHRNERVLKVGHVLVSQTTTEQFEKKYKGMLAESPLGYSSGRRSSNASNSSLLSQIANGQHPGLRRGNSANMIGYISTISEGDQDTLIVYNLNEEEDQGEKEKEKSEMGKFKKVFKGLASGGNSSHNSQSAEVQKDRTMLITSFGRALLFKLSAKDKYELRTEIDLTNSAVKFKEIIGDRRVKNLVTNGVFAIESLRVTLMFEVEKQDIIQWTTALVKSKDNQEERLLREVVESEMGSLTNASNAFAAAAIATINSPRLDSSSVFSGNNNETSPDQQMSPPSLADVSRQIRNYDMKTLSKLVQATRSPRQSLDESRQSDNGKGNSHHNHHHHHKLMDSKLKRKPPPKQVAKVPERSSDSNNGQRLISAAISTAMQNPEIRPSSNNRSSSFNRGSNGVASYFFSTEDSSTLTQKRIVSPVNGGSTTSSSSTTTTTTTRRHRSDSHTKNMITSLNSRFLARSQRKK